MNEFSRAVKDLPAEFPSASARRYTREGILKVPFDPLAPTERELAGFISNLSGNPRITDEWLAAYLSDPMEAHRLFEAAVLAEIEGRRAARARGPK